ncbi:MAG: 16S rRNA (cytosine(1402)-N(4))-methyltransferase RsmH [Candidatus Sungbacteria bacterium]|uniref:Ribosomal RNA small subunit methyltransferase H n=1 Tax=Candidatus Sungiibacteriota bacterium TaxID=2750080 RepID=A0A931SDH1_9BACT|nr:16S rRNA (cytosine(1402)-N(4))-methyltransferase RsmH [Candidatus Sungbacteria bacterium]
MHKPVLLHEVLEYLHPQPNENAIDATINGGGHAEPMLEAIAPRGKLLGIDRDPSILKETKERLKKFGDRAILAEGNFANIATIAEDAGVLHPSCILFDLGFSSYHLAPAKRGFSFLEDAPLDMRYNRQDSSCTAEALINHAIPEELERIFKTYGEERNAGRIAELIVRERKHRRIQTAKDLATLIANNFPRDRLHPATKVFQALRIAVNDELTHIERGIRDALLLLAPGGRLAIISYHSLEDRIVKYFFRSQKETLAILTPKPVAPSREEIAQNPRARSAKLRAAQKKVV